MIMRFRTFTAAWHDGMRCVEVFKSGHACPVIDIAQSFEPFTNFTEQQEKLKDIRDEMFRIFEFSIVGPKFYRRHFLKVKNGCFDGIECDLNTGLNNFGYEQTLACYFRVNDQPFDFGVATSDSAAIDKSIQVFFEDRKFCSESEFAVREMYSRFKDLLGKNISYGGQVSANETTIIFMMQKTIAPKVFVSFIFGVELYKCPK